MAGLQVFTLWEAMAVTEEIETKQKLTTITTTATTATTTTYFRVLINS